MARVRRRVAFGLPSGFFFDRSPWYHYAWKPWSERTPCPNTVWSVSSNWTSPRRPPGHFQSKEHCTYQRDTHRNSGRTIHRDLRRLGFSSQQLNCTSLLLVIFFYALCITGLSIPQDAEHLTAMVGDSIVFNCHIEFPESHPVPYVIQWEKKGVDIPIFIWYENYLHVGDGFEGRVSRVPAGSPYGLASLNLSRIRESDQGWYSCIVNFLNRSPRKDKNGTVFHLNVHAPPRFTVIPDAVVYVSLGDPIILSCLAEGTPTPEILWYRESELVQPSATLAVANDGTELRISSIRQDDIGDYTCLARNGEGTVRHTTKIVVAGGAVIIVPPHNITRLEGDKAEIPCEARGLPGNFSVIWYRESHAVRSIPWLESRTLLKKNGTLVINPVHSDDRGYYTCEVTNGIGEPQRASAYIDVEFPARVTFTPTVQYLPLRLSGVLRCHVEANPPFQFITWTKDKRIFDPFEAPNITVLNNGSLKFEKVVQEHQGRYTCIPYNIHGSAGSSGSMEVLVREPPTFVTRPNPLYQTQIGEDVQMNCEAQGTPNPSVTWRRAEGQPFPHERSRIDQGSLIITNLRRSDFGFYECHVSNEVATLVVTTHLVIEGTTPHAPCNITTEAEEFSITLEWLPGYSGGQDYEQTFVIWYRQEGAQKWTSIDVEPLGSTRMKIHNLQPGTAYEFQVIGKNRLGDGMFSNIVRERTKGQRPPDSDPTRHQSGLTSVTPAPNPTFGNEVPNAGEQSGPAPYAPDNVTITPTSDGHIISWSQSRKGNIAVAHYTIDFCTDDQWKRFSKSEIKPPEMSYPIKGLNPGKTYYFRVNSHSLKNQASSEKVVLVPKRVKDKAITAGIVGGILFFIVAIILAVCTVKCVNKRNKRRRREQEKAYSMVAYRMTDARNGGQTGPKSVPLKKRWTGRLPALTASQMKQRIVTFNHIIRNLLQRLWGRNKTKVGTNDGTTTEAMDWLEYGAAELHRKRRHRPARYSVEAEFLQPPGWISRTAEGKFIADEAYPIHPSSYVHSASYRPTNPVVESGIYRVGGDRSDWPRPQPILRREFSPLAVNAYLASPQFGGHQIPNQPTAAGRRQLRSSSPGPGLLSPSFANFSDVSSVRQPSSAERSFPTTVISSRLSSQPNTPQDFNRVFPNSVALSPSVLQSRYTRELPALLPIHEKLLEHPFPQRIHTEAEIHSETPRSIIKSRPHQQREFGLLLNPAGRHFHAPPPFRPPPAPSYQPIPYTISYPTSGAIGLSQRPLATSSPPRNRVSRTPEIVVRRRRSPLTIAVRLSPGSGRSNTHKLSDQPRHGIVEYSPQSQSSSSGFDSKNTSQQNQSSQSGSGSGQSQFLAESSWMASDHSKIESHYVNWPVQMSNPPSFSVLDASVDDHYEFDTTQSPNDTGPESTAPLISTSTTDPSGPGPPIKHRKVTARYENIEARVQAMKEEFQEYRKRRARGLLESAC